ncbi:MAG: HAMP domain-containing sensor histidine kinase [Kofleriaceae bacterium]
MNRESGPPVLQDFLATNRAELVRRCRAKVAQRVSPTPTEVELEQGIPALITQLISALRVDPASAGTVPAEVAAAASKHGDLLLRKGFTLEQVVNDYGDLCQALTELAQELDSPITVHEFHVFNRCLDSAIASAVTEFGRGREQVVAAYASARVNDRIGVLANELRTSVNAAMLAFSAIKSGKVAAAGATGEILDRSLTRLSDIVERTLAEVRLGSGSKVRPETIQMAEFLERLSVFAVLESTSRKLHFVIECDAPLVVHADPQLLASAISILLQNALRFTRRGGHVVLSARALANHVVVGVHCECGGLQPHTLATVLPLLQSDSIPDNSSGLSICRHSVALIGGTVGVRDLPGKGCIFTIELPANATTRRSAV